ncbi:unnamed protein product [Ilex paraguariensis]|uniref:CO(2)-response secreted protease n=1 Tax=Ilex paraguariensis TaxID=185542 RepID=A0ABC8UER1_9AQUA
MKGLSISYFCFSVFLFSFRSETEAASTQSNGVYIVYMGAVAPENGASRDDQVQLLSYMLRSKRDALVHSYKHGFSGFAARLSEEEAQSIAKKPGVVSVFPDPVLQLHTTRSWDFLKLQTDLEIDSGSGSDSNSTSNGSDTIIGILDTGIWPESESFSDKGMGPIPSQWNGTCMVGKDFNSSNCNRKLIGARYYDDPEDETQGSPRDKEGHGTHVASTAAGSPVPGASYYGLAAGTAKGGSPGSRIAVYRVCTLNGCRGSAILAAFDDAIRDGVDVLSLSLGASAGMEIEISSDPIAIGSFHAVEKGIMVVCSAGNDGPYPRSVVNVAPWILTVAATTIDRDFESDVVLGGNKVIKGEGINFADINKSSVYPLIYGKSAKTSSKHFVEDEARNCNPGSLDKNKVKGKIVLCENTDDEFSVQEKLDEVQHLGGIGLVLSDDDARSVASTFGAFPMTVVTLNDADEILSYINSTSNPLATILPTIAVTNYKPAPTVAYFSARGPSYSTKDLLKPDIAAPGVAILAAWPGNDTSVTLSGKESPLFNILSGTSMACPHVSGIAATVKSMNPSWSPSAIRSAIMTTATQTNNLKTPITTNSGSVATPYDFGAGGVSTTRPLQPGLVYETGIIDYLQFLCSNGYDMSQIKLISSTIPVGFSCSNTTTNFISNMNYPSIAISNFSRNGSKKVNRTVTNVGEDESLYTAAVDAPTGLDVKVIPNTLQFTKNIKKLSFEVIFTSSGSAPKEHVFGSITWTGGKYKVRSPFVVTSV